MDGSSSPPRSVKIGVDERTGWSSDRPRPGGGGDTPRERDISTRTSVLRPSFRLRYSPGSLVLLVSAVPGRAHAFAERVLEERGALLSRVKVEALLAGKVAADELDERVTQVLESAANKRLESGESTVVVLDDLSPETRKPLLHLATSLRRPRHLIFVEVPREDVDEEIAPVLNDLRSAVDTGAVGAEGIQTALRLGGGSLAEAKKLVFRPAPKDN